MLGVAGVFGLSCLLLVCWLGGWIVVLYFGWLELDYLIVFNSVVIFSFLLLFDSWVEQFLVEFCLCGLVMRWLLIR